MRSHMRSPTIRNHKIQSMNSATGRCAQMGKCKCCLRCSWQMKVPTHSNDSTSSYFLPETVEIKIIRIKIQKGLRSITRTVRLQHWRTGRYDCGLAWGVDGFELELWAHPQTPVGSCVSHNLYLERIRNHDLNVGGPLRAFHNPSSSCP